ncbi:HTH-type transcriptional repressor FabR [Stenotrophobium rhamnosiphilum]|uniref:HTH-type transcriptional repressor FabR n=1 Tax=Stenotrophobium rhamnosiphilum TaxID=2029166 RepID=A0A2T5MG81_9GAMM|nr:HTH-type transcriptional repressor FabR [Stenotrophobium rhamnosiphilum]PTU31595.1 HTH-type transcriptional repressor FabR [Stenotrophobium rhamnosiphilum]
MTSPRKAAATRKSRPPGQGRKPAISRQDVVDAALKLLGPHRSVATLSLREVARAANIAPNSFYRQFKSIDDLAVALIEQAGESLRDIIWKARSRITEGESVIRTSVETFLQQLQSDQHYLHLLLREGAVGSAAFKHAVERQLEFFEKELQIDLVRLATASKTPIHSAELVSRAITRLVFSMATSAVELPATLHPKLIDDTTEMINMIMVGTQTLAKKK